MSYEAELAFIGDQLNRIAAALERLSPPPAPPPLKRCQATDCPHPGADLVVSGMRLVLCDPHRAELGGGSRR